MKESIENSIKQSLANHELPYNEGAWTELSKKLDAKSPVATPKSNFRFYAAASAVIVISVVSYFAYNHQNNSSINTDNVDIAQNDQITKIDNKTTNNKIVEDKAVFVETKTDDVGNTIINENTNEESLTKDTSSDKPSYPNTNSENKGDNNINVEENNNDIIPGDLRVNIVLPTINTQCQGNSVFIKNTNPVALSIIGSELNQKIEGNSSKKIELKSAGIYTIQAANPKFSTDQTSFQVHKAPSVDFIVDSETKYEDGLPTTKVESISSGVEYNWSAGNATHKGKEANIHFYSVGDKNITLNVKDNNGCKNSITKSIYIEDKYNLMATQAFVPTDIDPRNNIFMPLALTLRDVRFRMMILDPTDGHVLFHTSDASQGWDGTDKDTGRPVKTETAYIWKVVIENPEIGESNEYAGNIIPMTSRR